MSELRKRISGEFRGSVEEKRSMPASLGSGQHSERIKPQSNFFHKAASSLKEVTWLNITRIERRNHKPEIMMYKRLGRTNFLVSRIALGGYGNPTPPRADDDPQAYESMLQFLIDNGVNYFDTAPDYGTERYFGDVLGKPENRCRVFISTKIRSMMKDPENNIPWSSKDEFEDDIRRQLDNSLRLLRTDYVDILFLHHLKELGTTPYLRLGYVGPDWQYFKWAYEIIDELISEGKVLYKGFTSHHPKTAKKAVLLKGYTTDAIMANYTVTTHMGAKPEDWEDTFLTCKSKDVGIIQMKALLGPKLLNKKWKR